MMKLGIFSAPVFAMARQENISAAEAFFFAAQQGLTEIEASSGDFARCGGAAAFAATLREAGVRLFAAHFLCHIASPDDALSLGAAQEALEVARQIAEAGGSRLMLVPAMPEDIADEADKSRALERIVERTAWLCGETEKLGVRVCCENFSRPLYPFCTPAELLTLRERLPGLGITFDSGNFRCHALDMPDAYEQLKNVIDFCHVKDWAVSDDGFPTADGKHVNGTVMGRGVVPLCDWFFRLRTEGRDFPMILEPDGTMEQISVRERIEGCAAFVRAHL